MNVMNQLLTRVGCYFNPTTLSGAIDVLVVQQPDGSLRGSPFHARFGKRSVLRPRDNLVDIYVNEQLVSGLVARLGPAGEVYFSAEPLTPATNALKAKLLAGISDDDSGHFSEPEVVSGGSGGGGGGGGDGDSLVDWRWGQLPRNPPTSSSLSPSTSSSSMPPSPASSWSSLLSFGDGENGGVAGRGRDTPPPSASTQRHQQQPQRHQERSIRLSSLQLRLLALKPGSNRLRYVITTKYQGTASCSCAVYLWRHDDRLVVSDIDGTITRSDLLGQLLPMVGKDWTQPTVVRLFSAVQSNGYRFVYLSSRGLGQSEATRRLLERVSQEGAPLPDGPILLSPASLLQALHREVIARRPQEFKVPCLRDVRELFPAAASPHGGPFWAGFGNRPSDAATYAEVGVPAERCYTVNSRGELLRQDGAVCAAFASYRALADGVDLVFPAYAAADASYSDYVYWRVCPPSLPPPAAAQAATAKRRRRSSSSTLAMCLSEVNFYL